MTTLYNSPPHPVDTQVDIQGDTTQTPSTQGDPSTDLSKKAYASTDAGAHRAPPVTVLSDCDNAGHGDHFAIFTNNLTTDLPIWLTDALQNAAVPKALADCKTQDKHLLLGTNHPCHLKQILSLTDGKPTRLINVFACVESPYGLHCRIKAVTACPNTQDAILHLVSTDGTEIYAFDQLYAINHDHYQGDRLYYVNFGAWAYNLSKSKQDEVIIVDDPKAIRYHRAFNDIVAKNDGVVPDDIDARIKAWQPADPDAKLAPVEINLGMSCIYLFGDTFGQQDEAWCQGQVLGKSQTRAFDRDIWLFDVVILREPEAKPLVVRIAALDGDDTRTIAVRDYIQANIWLQGAIYAANQDENSGADSA